MVKTTHGNLHDLIDYFTTSLKITISGSLHISDTSISTKLTKVKTSHSANPNLFRGFIHNPANRDLLFRAHLELV